MKDQREKKANGNEQQLSEWEKRFVREVKVLLKMTLPELMRVEQTGIPMSRY